MHWNIEKVSKPIAVTWHFRTQKNPMQGTEQNLPKRNPSTTKEVSTENLMEDIRLVVTEKLFGIT